MKRTTLEKGIINGIKIGLFVDLILLIQDYLLSTNLPFGLQCIMGSCSWFEYIIFPITFAAYIVVGLLIVFESMIITTIFFFVYDKIITPHIIKD